MSRPARAMEGAVGALETSMAQHRIKLNRRLEVESAWLRQAMEMLQERRQVDDEGQENPRSETNGKGKTTANPTLRRSRRKNKVEEEASDASKEEQDAPATRTRGKKRKSQLEATSTLDVQTNEVKGEDNDRSKRKTVLSPVEEVDAKPEDPAAPEMEQAAEPQDVEVPVVQQVCAEDSTEEDTNEHQEQDEIVEEPDVVAPRPPESADDALPERPAQEIEAVAGGRISHGTEADEAVQAIHKENSQPAPSEDEDIPNEVVEANKPCRPEESGVEMADKAGPQPAFGTAEEAEGLAEKTQEDLLLPGPEAPLAEKEENHEGCKTPAAPTEGDSTMCEANCSEWTKHAPYKTPAATVDGLADGKTTNTNGSERDEPNFSAEQLKARLRQLKDRTSPVEEANKNVLGAKSTPSSPRAMEPSASVDFTFASTQDVEGPELPGQEAAGKEQSPQKKTVKVAALQAAELARAAQKAKDEERKLRKEKFEQAKMAQQIELNGTNTASAAQKIQRALEVRAKLAENARLAREEEARKRREAFQKREEEAVARRKAKEEEEMRALEERRKRQEEIRQRQLALEERRRLAMEERERARKAYEEAEQERAAAEEQARLKRQADKRAEIEKRRREAEEAARKARLAAEESRERQRMAEAMYKQEQEAIWKAGQNGGDSISPYLGGRVDQENRPPESASTSVPSMSSQLENKEENNHRGSKVPMPLPLSKPPTPQHKKLINPSEYTSYEISPYKEEEDSDDDDERPRKPVPNWARSGPLGIQLRFQEATDPDVIFQAPDRTCDLKDMFQTTGNKRKRDWNRRSSSGNWNDDQLSHAEIMHYRRVMGYIDG